jgi:hypothetical protein
MPRQPTGNGNCGGQLGSPESGQNGLWVEPGLAGLWVGAGLVGLWAGLWVGLWVGLGSGTQVVATGKRLRSDGP